MNARLVVLLAGPALGVALLGVVAQGPVERPAAAAALASGVALAVTAAMPKDKTVNFGGREVKLGSAPAWAAVLGALVTLSMFGAWLACGLWAVGVLS